MAYNSVIDKHNIDIAPTPKKFTEVTWTPDITWRDWMGTFWTKKWLKWYTDLLRKGNIKFSARNNSRIWR